VLHKKTLCVYFKCLTVNMQCVCVCVCVCVLFTFAREAMRRDPRQAIFTDVAKGGPCVGAGVPVVHP